MSSEPAPADVATGGCLCGGVRYRVPRPLRGVWYCHCDDCKRVTGHHMAATSAPTASVEFERDATLAWYNSQPQVYYGFCSTCGSSLFWRADDKPDVLSICAGSLDPPTGLDTTGVLFGDNIADYIEERPGVEAHRGDRP